MKKVRFPSKSILSSKKKTISPLEKFYSYAYAKVQTPLDITLYGRGKPPPGRVIDVSNFAVSEGDNHKLEDMIKNWLVKIGDVPSTKVASSMSFLMLDIGPSIMRNVPSGYIYINKPYTRKKD